MKLDIKNGVRKLQIPNHSITGLEALTILFIALKLIGVITWSWWWVLSPVLIPTIVACSVLFLVFCAYGVAQLIDKIGWKRSQRWRR